MRVIGLDPGSAESAYVVLGEGTQVLCEHEKAANPVVLSLLRERPVSGVVLALEMVASYGMAVGKEVFETVRWIGRFQEAWESRGGACTLVYRRDVKLYLCATSKANDANIRAALIDRYGPGKDIAVGRKAAPGPLFGLKGDEWQAFAVGLTCAESMRTTADARPELALRTSGPSTFLPDQPF